MAAHGQFCVKAGVLLQLCVCVNAQRCGGEAQPCFLAAGMPRKELAIHLDGAVQLRKLLCGAFGRRELTIETGNNE